MSDGMRVDLSALDEVIRRLWTLLDDMDEAGKTSRYRTDISTKAFGTEGAFQEASELALAYKETKGDLEGAIASLHGLITRFGTSTSKVKDKYTEQEYANRQQMGDGSGNKSFE